MLKFGWDPDGNQNGKSDPDPQHCDWVQFHLWDVRVNQCMLVNIRSEIVVYPVLYNALRCGGKKSFDITPQFLYKEIVSSVTEFIRRVTVTASILNSTFVNL